MERKNVPAPSLSLKTQPRKKKSNGRLIAALISILLLVALLAGAVVCYLNDYFGMRSSIVAFFISQDTQYQERMASLDQREAALLAKETALNDMAAQQEKEAEKQQKTQEKLDAQQAELETANQDLASRMTAFDNNVAELDKLVDTVSNMSPKAAAAMLESMTPIEDAANLLIRMESKDAAAILEEMTAEGARQMTSTMLLLSQ